MAEFAKHKKSLLNETNAELVNARKKRTKRRFWLFSILTLVFIGAAVYFAWYPRFLIQSSIISGNRVLSTNKLESSINEYLNGRFIYVLPNRNAFLFSGDDLKKYLVNKHPIIKNIEVSQNIPHGIYVHVTERQPHALWCNVSPNDCVFIDTAGYAYDNAPYFSKPLFTVYELPGADLTKKVLDEDSFMFSETIMEGLHKDGILVQKIRPMGEGVFEFDVLLKDQVLLTSITTKKSIGAYETLNRFFSLTQSDDVVKHVDTFLKKIDVRFGNKIVYSFY